MDVFGRIYGRTVELICIFMYRVRGFGWPRICARNEYINVVHKHSCMTRSFQEKKSMTSHLKNIISFIRNTNFLRTRCLHSIMFKMTTVYIETCTFCNSTELSNIEPHWQIAVQLHNRHSFSLNSRVFPNRRVQF